MIRRAMPVKLDKLAVPLERLDAALAAIIPHLSAAQVSTIDRWRADAAALRFHLKPVSGKPAVTVVVGGTGTGKSTLVNRLIGADVTATSFRRTFTAAPVAIIKQSTDLPTDWLAIEHIVADALPVRGNIGSLIVVESPGSALPPLVDTPDLDGDQPAHHAQADRAFRWAQRLIFVVTPEKYQMTELLPYYSLARRYEIPALFVMNKSEEQEVIEDFRRQLAQRDWPEARIFIVARDDAGFNPPVDWNLTALRDSLTRFDPPAADAEHRGQQNRAADVTARLVDQIINPLRTLRAVADATAVSLRSMETPPAGINVNPITQQLQRRLQQRSVLYLMGPQRVLDRVRQMPTLAARLPRAAWDWVMRGNTPNDLLDPKTAGDNREPPDFPALLADQFTALKSRIDDCLRSNPTTANWIAEDPDYKRVMLEPVVASSIAIEEIESLRQWLQTRWNATPRDTRVLQSLLKYLPGGRKLTKWSETAPYLLTLALIMHGAFFGHLDLMVLGGYSIATWLTERISNEVTSRTRNTNRKISERFEQLAHQQIKNVIEWLNRKAPSTRELDNLDRLARDLMEIIEPI